MSGMQSWPDVRRYGVVGDGVTDDTQAIQRAIDAVQLVELTPGTVKISAPIILAADRRVRGASGDSGP